MTRKAILRLISKKAMIYLLPFLVLGLLSFALVSLAGDPCVQGTAGGTTRFVDPCED